MAIAASETAHRSHRREAKGGIAGLATISCGSADFSAQSLLSLLTRYAPMTTSTWKICSSISHSRDSCGKCPLAWGKNCNAKARSPLCSIHGLPPSGALLYANLHTGLRQSHTFSSLGGSHRSYLAGGISRLQSVCALSRTNREEGTGIETSNLATQPAHQVYSHHEQD
jgi:hypothetical protein